MKQQISIFIMLFSLLIVFAGYTDMDTSPIRINQVGYFPEGNKIATIVDTRTYGISWELHSASGQTVTSGTTRVYGNDIASGDHIHKADFSSYTQVGADYRLWVNGIGESVPFTIASNIYSGLDQDAMAYFYFHRMGEATLSQYLEYPQHAHDALHTETAVSAFNNWTNETFNVRYSWADAGDFGIYPVNHAISAWTLLNLYERNSSAFPDGSLSIPENSNGVPDVLDEVRFGSTYMYNMLPGSGLASHKVHNVGWTSPWQNYNFVAIENSFTRHAQPPSTAATYAVARTMAQMARIFQSYDSASASSMWTRAEQAWQRAETSPVILYSAQTVDDEGGGDYTDTDVDDDRYVAACELYLTAYKRGDADLSTYRSAVTGSSDYMAVTEFNWEFSETTGTLSLLSAANDLPALDLNTMQSNVISYVDNEVVPYLTAYNAEEEGYPVALDGAAGYEWGSNAIMVNNLILSAFAYDMTGNITYLKAIASVMDYLLGTNTMRLSYITGWGEYAEEDPHDRYAISCLNDLGIPVPSGWLIGGPNNLTVNDNATPVGVPPAKAYAEPGTGPEAWASKENTINWNAPLAWIAWYLNDRSLDLGSSTVATPTPDPATPTPEPLTPPPNLIDISGGMWRTFIDPYGSSVNPPPDTNILSGGAASADFTMMPEPTVNGEYPYGGILFAFDTDNSGQNITLPIVFTYMSAGSIRFSIAQRDLASNGEAWGFNLPPAETWTTIGITEEMLAQPTWVTAPTPLDLTDVIQFKWEPKLGALGGDASVSVANFMVGSGSGINPTAPPATPTAPPVNPTTPPGSGIDVSLGRWGTYADPYGSTVSPVEGTNALVNGVASASFYMMPEPTVNGQYPYAGLFFNFDNAESPRYIDLPIVFTYTSSGNIRFTIGQPVLKDNGQAWGYNLPASSSQRTITITESMLAQPSWVSSPTPLDLTGVLQLKWEPKMGSSGGAASITVRDLSIPDGSSSAVVYGDVNSDGLVNIIDALMTAQYYVGINVPGFNPANADVNRDNLVTIVDALIIAQYYVRLITVLPI